MQQADEEWKSSPKELAYAVPRGAIVDKKKKKASIWF